MASGVKMVKYEGGGLLVFLEPLTKSSNYGAQVYYKGGTTIKNLLMAPKDIDPMMKKSRVIYSYKCGRVECDEEYIGESSRTFGERFKNTRRPPPSYLTILTPLAIA